MEAGNKITNARFEMYKALAEIQASFSTKD